jgi:small subunit ribosomal protein S8
MGQDVISDALNRLMNAKKAGKKTIVVERFSKVLENVLKIAKEKGYLNYNKEDNKLKIEIIQINEIKTIKPRFTVSKDRIDRYVRRYLPAKNFGFLIISTNKGLMTHEEALEKNIGGCLIAYVF